MFYDSLNQLGLHMLHFFLYRKDISFSAEPSLFLKTSMTWLKVTSERCRCMTDYDMDNRLQRRVLVTCVALYGFSSCLSHPEDVCVRFPARKNTSTVEFKRKRYFSRTNIRRNLMCTAFESALKPFPFSIHFKT